MVYPDSKHRAEIKKISSQTRKWRRIHKLLGLGIAILLLISSATGILLALKKDFEILQPGTRKGEAQALISWKPLDHLAKIGELAILNEVGDGYELDRIDVRPGKGIAKLQFQPGSWEVQVDGQTGEVLNVAQRYSDIIEHIHDGSIISDWFKLISMNVLGWGMLIIIFTGFLLWYGPRRIRSIKRL